MCIFAIQKYRNFNSIFKKMKRELFYTANKVMYSKDTKKHYDIIIVATNRKEAERVAEQIRKETGEMIFVTGLASGIDLVYRRPITVARIEKQKGNAYFTFVEDGARYYEFCDEVKLN